MARGGAGVGKICKNMKIGKKLENGLGVVGGGLDWCKMISAVVGTFLNRFWLRIHLKNNEKWGNHGGGGSGEPSGAAHRALPLDTR